MAPSPEPDAKAIEEPLKAPASDDGKKLAPFQVSYLALFRGGDFRDNLMLYLGLIAAVINGVLFPLYTIILGKFINAFGEFTAGNNSAFRAKVALIALDLVYLAIAAAVTSYLEVTMLMLYGNRQTNRLKQRYLDAVLRQDIAYFDTQATTGGLLQGLNDDSIAVQQGISEKLSLFVHHVATFVAGLIIAFTRGWDMTLVLLGCVPFLVFAGKSLASMTTTLAEQSTKAYAQASEVAEQNITQVRTVFAYGQEKRAHKDYADALEKPVKVDVRSAWVAGFSLGGLQFVMFCTVAIALIYGAHRVSQGAYTGGQVLNVMLATLIASFGLGQAAPSLTFFAKARVGAARMLAVIERQPAIIIEEGREEPSQVVGNLEINCVNFAYPSRMDVTIFRDFSLSVPAGSTMALCGSSGSGKSTVVSLIERFYDPASGSITLDGVDLRRLSLRWLRDQVGLVSQEPTLFATTILQNIQMGRPGATAGEVEAAARSANAHTFVSALPLGYDTQVGERGMQLSGGQKQRIAIARAILKNPKILLLDEATSALDTPSERVVQEALDRMVVGRTTLIIAHRLSTIRGANTIAVMREGQVVERGTHQELLQDASGVYFALVQLQVAKHEVDKQDVADYDVDEVPLPQPSEPELPSLKSLDAAILAANDAPGGPHGHALTDKHVLPIGAVGIAIDVGGKVAMGTAEGKKGAAVAAAAPAASVSIWRLLELNRPEWWMGCVGIVASACAGATQPAFSFVLTSMLVDFYKPKNEIWAASQFLSGMFVVIGAGTFLAALVQQASFGIMGLHLSRRVRLLLFAAILRQEIGWFDNEDNSSGRLISSLATEATHVRGAVGDTAGVVLQGMSTAILSLFIAFYFDWRVALLIFGCAPLMVIAGILSFRLRADTEGAMDKMYANANQTISDAFTSIRTIQAFNMQLGVGKIYSNLQTCADRTAKKQAMASGLGQAFPESVKFFIMALVIWFGGIELTRGWTDFNGFFKAFLVVLFGAMGIARATAAFPDVAKAKVAIAKVFPIIDRVPLIDSGLDFTASLPAGLEQYGPSHGAATVPGGKAEKSSAVVPSGPARGDVEFRNVRFCYPSRPTAVIFRDFSLRVAAGQVAALVGESGSGKSTVVGLMERFYDVQAGSVFLDGIDLRQINLQWLRSQMALVSQEPLLFRGSILVNIRFGRPNATLEEVREAAASANALKFIDALPDGLDTLVGEGGVQLSGGQKQRVAIARAIIKNPKVLLLDEATSALDAESESVVQAALNTLMAGRTALVIAHRLSTIRGAGAIAVMSKGEILEQGTHSDLLARRGHYSRLVQAQASKTAEDA